MNPFLLVYILPQGLWLVTSHLASLAATGISLSTLPSFSCIQFGFPTIFCPTTGQSSLIHQPIKSAHIHTSEDSKETRPSKSNRTDEHMNSQRLWQCTGLYRFKPDGVPRLGEEVDIRLWPWPRSYLKLTTACKERFSFLRCGSPSVQFICKGRLQAQQ